MNMDTVQSIINNDSEVKVSAVSSTTGSNFVYVHSKEHAWVPARLLEISDDQNVAIVQLYRENDNDDTGEIGETNRESSLSTTTTTITVQLSEYPNQTLPLQNLNDAGTIQDVGDMIDLPFLHEPGILYNLKARHRKCLPYTRTGDIIVAVNPYQWNNYELYTTQQQQYYSNALVWSEDATTNEHKKTLEPHVYEVSALAYRGVAVHEQDQSILVSGESGAGKTETVKICLNHITSCVVQGSSNNTSAVDGGSSSVVSPVVQRVIDSNPLLEAFGNAKTIRNDNSSRFGKYIQLQIDRIDDDDNDNNNEHDYNVDDPLLHEHAKNSIRHRPATCVLAGSRCEVYLLEKSRVVSHNSNLGERTYHIFYQLLAASDTIKADIWTGLVGTTTESFRYVGSTTTSHIEGQSDGERFLQTIQSLDLIGVKGSAFQTLFRAICTVLQLGNIVFASDPQDTERTVIASETAFEQLGELMGIATPDLLSAFTHRRIEARGEMLSTSLTPDKAQDACDAFAKEIYECTFMWLVRQINDSTCAEKNYGGRKSGFRTIGLLDIFGFESFQTNGFEQICINYANEMLQQKFTQDVFSTVMAEYESEGIQFENITYDDNTNVLDLIEGRTGLLAMLNEESIRPNGNDATFVRKACAVNKTSQCLIVRKLFRELEFGIQHYAGEVVYTAGSFVTKNTDTIPNDMKEIAKKSSNDIIAKILCKDGMVNSEGMGDTSSAVGVRSSSKGQRQKGSNIVGLTVWTKFRTQLNSLMGKLNETQTRYIRCIKPNSIKAPLVMEHATTVEQLRSAGVVAAVTISRSSFPNRLDHKSFLLRFRCLWSKRDEINCEGDFQVAVEKLLSSTLAELKETMGDATEEPYAIGRTRTYFRAGALENLEALRRKRVGRSVLVIQRIVRGFLHRQWVKKQRTAARRIIAQMQRYMLQRNFKQTRRLTIKIQCWYRCLAAKQKVKNLRIYNAAVAIQAKCRHHRDYITFQSRRAAIVHIQRQTRGMIQRKRYHKVLAEKRRQADMERQLATMQQELVDMKAHYERELEKERALFAEKMKAEVEKARVSERESMEQELRELRMEKELILLQNEAVRLRVETAVMAPPTWSTTAPTEETLRQSSSSPQTVVESADRSPVASGKHFEAVRDSDSTATSIDSQNMTDTEVLIDNLRRENVRLKRLYEKQKMDSRIQKEEAARLVSANMSAGSSFQSLSQHAKQLNGTNQSLLKSVAQYRNQVSQLSEDLKSRQNYCRELAAEYKTETEIRIFYETTMIEIVDMVNITPSGRSIQQLILEKAAECTKVSRKKTVGYDKKKLEESCSSFELTLV